MRFTTKPLAIVLAGCAAIGLAAPAVAQDTPPAPPAEEAAPAPAPEYGQPAPEAEQPQPGDGDQAQPQQGDQPSDGEDEAESPEG